MTRHVPEMISLHFWLIMIIQINTQLVPPSEPLMATLPSGRDIHTVKPFTPPQLDQIALSHLRAMPDNTDTSNIRSDDDSSDDAEEKNSMPPGSFPGSSRGDPSDGSYY